MFRQIGKADNLDAGLRDLMVVIHCAAANAYCANQHAVLVDDGQAAGKGNQAVIGMLYAVKLAVGQGQFAQITGRHRE